MLGITTKVHNDLWESYRSKAFNVFVLEGGSRSSKTHSIIQFWIKWAFLRKGRSTRVAVCRLKGTWLEATVLKDFIDVLQSVGLYNPKNHNKTKKVIKLFDTEFWFIGLDDSQKIHGFKSDAFWINEAVEAGYDDYAQLMQRCNGFAILDYNPSFEEHWVYDRILQRPRTYYNHSTMLDNPLISRNAKEQILSYEPTEENYKNGTADERKWKIYGLGQRAALEGLVFEYGVHWDIIKEVPAWAKKIHRWGLDFGYTNDPTAIGDHFWTGSTNEVWLDELCYKTQMLNTDIGKILKDNGLVGIKGYADSSEPKSIDEIFKMGLNVHPVDKPQGSVNTGIDIMKRHKIHITERSLNFIKEWRNYTWQQDKNGKWLNVPCDTNNHGIDESRYVFFMEKAQKSERTSKNVSKASLGFY
ncbi:PBSX family phage terminase large subunit [Parapedobacter indicus]|uniref:Phage terminase large subunit n=1 Tax=Parapedobacter indicus TaxID=1477437 RepID=A0A1I3V1W3_9SPHI|nr:PBSX family phage terminase large subunit [Parapedobacter indicus]PPK98994.1 phage terminase large subunit [Parapedobacter indicus]SFJ89225.1 phage terminase large subunit [Parapedobacter indicus]